jgi:hypothetical protein
MSENEFLLPNANAEEKLFAVDNKYVSLDDYLDGTMTEMGDMFPIAGLIQGQKRPNRKRPKTEDLKPIVFVNFNTRQSKSRPVILQAVLDSGGSGSLVTEKFTRKLKRKAVKSDTVWSTPAGALNTGTKCKTTFNIPKLHDSIQIKWDLYVTKSLGAHDMIIGRDMMSDLGIDTRLSNNSVCWNKSEIPMKDRDATFEESFYTGDTAAMEEATDRVRIILEAKYGAANAIILCT